MSGGILPTINFILPVYNNAASLELLYDEIIGVISKLPKKYSYELFFVNDGSKDNSLEVLRSISQKDKQVTILNLSRNFGHQAAVSAALDNTTGDAVIIMDADLQDPPRVCLELIARWEEGYEIIYAQRRTRDDGYFKKLTADLYYRLLSSLSAVDIPRNTGDFRLVDSRVVDVIREMKEHNRFLRGMFSYTGFKQKAVLFDRSARHSGKSEYTLKKLIKLAKDGIYGFSDVPLQLATRFGFMMSVLSTLGILYAVVLKVFWSHITVPGWTMIVTSIFLVGGVQLLILGVIGEYIGRIYNETRNRPNYIIAERIKNGKSDVR